jgi:hypothetical protein
MLPKKNMVMVFLKLFESLFYDKIIIKNEINKHVFIIEKSKRIKFFYKNLN